MSASAISGSFSRRRLDVDVHGTGSARVGVAPHVREQQIPRQDTALVLEQVLEQEELLGRQPDLTAVDQDDVPFDVHGERAVSQEPGGAGPMGAPQQRAHARDHFVGAERLGDVVVGAQLEPDDAIRLFGPGREHDDRDARRARVTAQRAAYLQAVEAGEHQVEQQQVGQRAAHRRQDFRAGVKHVHGKAGAPEAVAEQVRDVVVVLDDQQTLGRGSRRTGHGPAAVYVAVCAASGGCRFYRPLRVALVTPRRGHFHTCCTRNPGISGT